MATVKTFEEIDVWKKARDLTKRIYAVSGAGTFAQDFSLKDQIRRLQSRSCPISLTAMIEVERESSYSFWTIANGSTAEVKCQLYLALDQNYLDQRIFAELSGLAMETGNMVGGLMKYLRGSGIKGTKYKTQ